jgi:pilus assembly protein Flp/PilA
MKSRLASAISCFARDERGGTAIEYGLIIGLMVIAILGAMNSVADANNDQYELITDSMPF